MEAKHLRPLLSITLIAAPGCPAPETAEECFANDPPIQDAAYAPPENPELLCLHEAVAWIYTRLLDCSVNPETDEFSPSHVEEAALICLPLKAVDDSACLELVEEDENPYAVAGYGLLDETSATWEAPFVEIDGDFYGAGMKRSYWAQRGDEFCAGRFLITAADNDILVISIGTSGLSIVADYCAETPDAKTAIAAMAWDLGPNLCQPLIEAITQPAP